MEYLTNDHASPFDEVSTAGQIQASGHPDQRASVPAREFIRARANRLYLIGELALSARLTMDLNALA